MAKIVLMAGADVLKEIPLDCPPITIGRKPENDLVIEHTVVSGRHARICAEDSRFFIEDTGSTNGTYLHGQRVQKEPLQDGDRVLIGSYALVFRDDPGRAPEARETIGRLVVVTGSDEMKEYELSGPLDAIGSDKTATVRLGGWFAPKTAAVIRREGTAYFVRSGNGGKPALLNGEPVLEERQLQSGDFLTAADVMCQFDYKMTGLQSRSASGRHMALAGGAKGA